jgi:hypothetical protein
MNKNLNTGGWVSENQKPPIKDGQPIEVEMLTDFDDDILEGYYDDGTWWIKLSSPAVGHQDYRTFSVDFEITHWRVGSV